MTRPRSGQGRRHSVLASQRVRRPKKKKRVFPFLRALGSSVFRIAAVGLVVGVVSLLFIYSYHYLMEAPFLELKNLEIRCDDSGLRNRIKEICEVPPGTTLLALDLGQLKRDVEGDPWVRRAVVERRFPHTLIVEVERQRPVAFVLIKPKLYVMNHYGELFMEAQGNEGLDLPIITGLSDEGHLREGQLKGALKVLGSLRKGIGPWTLNSLSEIHIRENGRYSLYFDHLKAEVRVVAADMDSRLRRLSKVVGHLSNSGLLSAVSRIDLLDVREAVVSFKEG